ncbi:MAG: HEAT repeat domain-containing protein [Planctomycetota bacterium]
MPVFSLATAVLLCGGLLAGQAGTPNGNEMPLELYQKLKAAFDTLYGAQVGMLPGLAPPTSKTDTEKALSDDAAANKGTLVKALGSSQTLQREMAARALEYCGDRKTVVAALIKVVEADSDSGVRRAAAATLAKLPDAGSVEALIKGLSDDTDTVRGLCATGLGNIKDSRASEPLLKLLTTDSKPIVRLQAATALSKIGDKANLEGLAKALENEKDERVKMAIAGAVRKAIGGETAQTEAMPTVADLTRELSELAKEMKDVEDKLRNDRHDQAVQVQGSGIEKRLAQLIEKLDKGCDGSGGSSSGKGDKNQQKQKGNQSNPGKNAGNPLKDSTLGSAVQQGSVNPALVAGKQDAWAKLPPAQRDELLQAFREEMPERWRKRLEAYFLSIAAEEARETEK